MSAKRDTLYLVDGSYYIYRAYYALRGLSNSKGFPTNALFGFVGMLQKLIADESPEYLVVTFDPRGGSFRRDLFPEYKANRQAPPEDLTPQLPLFRDLVRAYDIPVAEIPGFEADDVMGTLATKARARGMDVVIITGDKDLSQLVCDEITLLDTMRDKRVGPAEVRERFLVEPARVPDVFGLMGDSSDNIPGVPGVGEKTATKLIADYGSLEGVMEHLADFAGKKLGERLAEHRDAAFLSRDLATIRVDLPEIELDPDAARVGAPNIPALSALFRDWEFTRHLDELQAKYGPLPSGEEPLPGGAEITPKRYLAVTSPLALDQLVGALREAGRFSLTLEWSGSGAMTAILFGLAVAHRPDEAYYLPVGHDPLREPAQLAKSWLLERLRPLLEDATIAKVCARSKEDRIVLARHGITLAGVTFDTALASYVLDPTRRGHGLADLGPTFLSVRPADRELVLGKGAKAVTLGELPIAEAAPLACEEADLTRALEAPLRAALADEGGAALLDELELPLASVLASMEQRGLLVDATVLAGLSGDFETRMAEVEREAFTAAGTEFNLNSPKQLAEVLFEKLELPVVKRTKTGPSTDHFVLEQLGEEHPVPALILSYRSLSKLKGTYADALPLLIHPETGRIHTDFSQTVAATGRLSSNNPNLQNIPVRTAEGRRIRSAFIAPPGKRLFSADYSQVELRILAHMSGEPVLIDAFRRGQDIHARTASELFDVAPDQITKGQRATAKTINFGVLYGMGPFRLSRELQIPRTEAKAFIERYFERLEGVNAFLDGLVVQARERGFAETLLGRRRPLPELASRNQGVRAQGERLAVNTPIQGTAADIIKVAMVRVERRLRERDIDAAMLLQVHDELLFEVSAEHLPPLRELVVAEMEGAMELAVPLRVDARDGANWAEL